MQAYRILSTVGELAANMTCRGGNLCCCIPACPMVYTSLTVIHCPQPKVLRQDFSSLGVEPIVASVGAADLRLAGDYRAWDVSWVSVPGDIMAAVEFSCLGINITAAYTGEGVCTTRILVEPAGQFSDYRRGQCGVRQSSSY